MAKGVAISTAASTTLEIARIRVTESLHSPRSASGGAKMADKNDPDQ